MGRRVRREWAWTWVLEVVPCVLYRTQWVHLFVLVLLVVIDTLWWHERLRDSHLMRVLWGHQWPEEVCIVDNILSTCLLMLQEKISKIRLIVIKGDASFHWVFIEADTAKLIAKLLLLVGLKRINYWRKWLFLNTHGLSILHCLALLQIWHSVLTQNSSRIAIKCVLVCLLVSRRLDKSARINCISLLLVYDIRIWFI